MKKILLLLTTFTALCCISCSDDDNNGPAFSADGKRMVKSISWDWWESEGMKGSYTFAYNKDGSVKSIEEKDTWEDEDDGKAYTDVTHINFSVSGDKLVVKTSYKDDEGTYSYGGTFLLNEDGLVESGEWENDDEDSFSYSCFYNDDLQLVKTYGGQNGTRTYVWQDDNYVQLRDGYYSLDNFTYYDKENKANFDFGRLLNQDFGDIHGLYLHFTGYLGKTSRNLIKSDGYYTYTYEYDEDGYVTKIIEKGYGETSTYEIKYN